MRNWLVILIFGLQLPAGLAANLVRNSSAELGPDAGGWVWTGPGQDVIGVNRVPATAADAQHGTYSFKLVHDGNNQQIASRPFWLDGGTQYTFSFYAKAAAGTINNFRYGINRCWEAATADGTITLTGSFARTSYNITPAAGDWYVVYFVNFSGSSTALIDAIQVEEGASATTYAPMDEVELGLKTSQPFNLFTQSETPEFTVALYNDGTEASTEFYYEVFDIYNDVVTNGFATNTTSADTLDTLSFPLPINGWQRIVAREKADLGNADEIICNVYPLTARAIENNVDGRFGTHGNYSPLTATNLARVGFTYDRGLSIKQQLFSWQTIEASQGTYSFNYNAFAAMCATNGLIDLGTLGPTIGSPPLTSWMTNGDHSLNLVNWSNYVWRTVDNYKDYGWTNWCVWNEYGDEFTAQTDFKAWFNTPANAASVFGKAIQAITNADATARIILFDEWWIERNAATWTNIDAGLRSEVDVLAGHMYPQDQEENHGHNRYYLDDDSIDAKNMWNTGYGTNGMVANWETFSAWHAANASDTELWNTEYGSWSFPVVQGLDWWWYNRGTLSSYQTSWPNKSYFWERMRGPVTVARVISSTCRGFGRGWEKNIYYDSRSWYWDEMIPPSTTASSKTHTTLMGHGNRNHKSQMAALMVCQAMLDEFTSYTAVTNSTQDETDIEMYLFEVPGSNILTGWSLDFKVRDLDIAQSYTVYDMMGNEVTQPEGYVRFTRYPQYYVSTAAAATIKSDFEGATPALLSDTNAPNTSISVLPQGDGYQLQWFAYGDRWINDRYSRAGYYDNATNIVFAWSTNNVDFTDYTQTNFITLALASDDTVYVKAKDRDGNIDTATFFLSVEEGSEPVDPPAANEFTPLIRTLNVGTLKWY